MAADVKCGDIHGKEFHGYSKFHHEFQRSHFEANVRHLNYIAALRARAKEERTISPPQLLFRMYMSWAML